MKIIKIMAALAALPAALTLSAPASPPNVAGVKAISVRDFGAKGDGAADDTAAINTAIEAGEKAGPGAVVTLPAGRYRTAAEAAKSLVIQNADGLTVQGEPGAMIVSADLSSPVFRINDSRGVTVRNLAIDHDPLGYTQGTITSVDMAHMTCDVSIDPGYPDPDAPQIKGGALHPFVFPKPGYYQLDRYWPQPTQMEKTGARTWRWTLTGPPNIDNWAGKRFIIEGNTSSHAFEMRNVQDGTVEDVNYWGGGANAGFYTRGLEGTTTFRHFVIGVPPGSGRLYSCGGGGQISGLRGILVFDGCDFSKIDDDGIDILSTWTRIIAQSAPRTWSCSRGRTITVRATKSKSGTGFTRRHARRRPSRWPPETRTAHSL